MSRQETKLFKTPPEVVKRRAQPPTARPDAPHGRGQKKKRGWGRRLFVGMVWLGVVACLAIAAGIAGILVYYSSQLPDFRKLTEYKPPLITKVYDRENRVIAEFARERRIWVPIDQVPKPLIEAFLAAEDTQFYQHGGYDLKAIARAAIMNVLTDRMQGASTITQQVAKTFLLTNERTYTRKIKELILSWRIENSYSKDQILELYLNRIYLGNGSYGVGAAAQTYFSKSLDELTMPERAMIAGMPQAPSRYNPVRNPDAARARRDIIIRRMQVEGFITREEADAGVASPLVLNLSPLKSGEDAPHFSEYIRRSIEQEYGSEALYNDGMTVYTTLDLDMQRAAEKAVLDGLRAYDRRHGWRGALGKVENMGAWVDELDGWAERYADSWRIGRPAVVLGVQGGTIEVGLEGGVKGKIVPAGYKWTGRSAGNLVNKRDVVLVKKSGDTYTLEQLPNVQGALVALDVRSGEVRAMVGGLGQGVGFNRALQARRQMGSAFKPLVYAAALEQGYTPASIILDAPVVFRNADGSDWKPSNYDETIVGPTPLRRGLEKSRNLMTIRLAQDIGLRPVADVVRRFGFSQPMGITDLTLALGTYQATPLEAAAAYAVFPRGGQHVAPTFIRRVQDAQGATVQRRLPLCDTCLAMLGGSRLQVPEPPEPQAVQAYSPQLSYIMTSMMEGVIQRGTGTAARALGRPLAGKTGTTNDYVDAWFVGYSPTLAVSVWVGRDTPTSLGHGEAGSRAALPIWQAFMGKALEAEPKRDFAVPEGIEFVRIDAESGYLPGVSTKNTILEAFMPGTAPTMETPWLGDDGMGLPPVDSGGDGFNFFGLF